MPEISRYAVVDPRAKIADDVRIGSFTWIGPHVELGPGCVVENNVTITGRTTLGERNHVFPLAVLGSAPDGGEDGQLIIGDANVIREHVTIYGGQEPTRIGTDNLIMIGCQFGAGCQVGHHGIFVNSTQVAAEAVIEDYVRTSAFIVIEPGVRVGAYTFTLGYAEIDRDAPPFAMVQGSPFRVRGVNTENLRRCGFEADDIRELKLAFRELFDGESAGGVNTAILRTMLTQAAANSHVRRLAEAVHRSLTGRHA